jgi:FAD/FMN-containing dehydrogenase/Fe-S oxidoreductase
LHILKSRHIDAIFGEKPAMQDLQQHNSSKQNLPRNAPYSTSTMAKRKKNSARQMVDSDRLWRELGQSIDGDVRQDAGHRALYATDASNYRFSPIAVVMPKHDQDVVKTIEFCKQNAFPILSRGGGTSLAGQCTNRAVILEFSRYMNEVNSIDESNRLAHIEPGLVLDDLRDAAEPFGLTFGPDPSTHNRCTLGGMIGNNSCGVHSVIAGRTADNVHEMDVVTYDGLRMRVGPTSEEDFRRIIADGGPQSKLYLKMKEIADTFGGAIRRRFPDIPRRVSGYALEHLLPEHGFNVARSLVGSEGTLATILGASVRLIPRPEHRVLLLMGFKDIYIAGDYAAQLRDLGATGIEGVDDRLMEDLRRKGMKGKGRDLFPQGKGWLIAEFSGDSRQKSKEKAQAVARKFEGIANTTVIDNVEERQRIWGVRESGLGATARFPGGATWEGWEDAAVPPERLGDYLRKFRALMDKYAYHGDLYGHFGDGCIHVRINFDLITKDGQKTYRAFAYDAADLVISMGGSLSGEHGDGQSRGELLHKMFGPEVMLAFKEFKQAWDPHGMMNPGKVIEPNGMISDLRISNFPHEPMPTYFKYPDDDGSLAKATTRCVGVGECRKTSGGIMCPSYMVTREEKHSTRGRAHLLFEMIDKKIIKDGWQSKAVKESLDLCLACKGCKSECPVSVDVATYKAEFMAQHYKGKMRPLAAYAMGLIPWWSRIATHMPRFVNFAASAPGISNVAKKVIGIASQREVPKFAIENFRTWFEKTPRKKVEKRILLWADTFTNYFEPHIGKDAVAVLEDAGFQVEIPQIKLCCGRPLYDFGMLDLAKSWLLKIMDHLEEDILDGTPIVGLEPSCVAVFRDELTSLFPHDERAQKLSKQVKMIGEFLGDLPDYVPPTLEGKALMHVHCHQKSVLTAESDLNLCKDTGLQTKMLDSGCCGMAGSFGFEKEKYEVSVKCAERVLLPAVREWDDEELVITNGFSCREQIRQLGSKRAYHLAEVLARGLRTPKQDL